MTFEQLADTYQAHLAATDPDHVDNGREQLADWLEDVGGESVVLQRRVRIILASAGFDPHITTTVLWLNDVYGLDITCVRLTPYRLGDKLLLDVQQVIPLPEAAELTVQLRRRESAARAAEAGGGPDWTPYVVITPTETTKPLRKRRAVLALVKALHSAGVQPADMAEALPGHPRLLPVKGVLDGEELRQAFALAYPRYENGLTRWFFEDRLYQNDQTWVLSKMWGADTVDALDALLKLAPASGYDYETG